MITILVKEANFGYAVPARPQAPPSAVLPAPRLGWPCPHPCRGTEARTSSPWHACRGGRHCWGGCLAQRWSPPLVRVPVAEVVASTGEPLGAEVVATAGEPSVQRWSLPSVQRWSPPLASRSELASNATLLVQSSPFLQSRDGARTLLEGGCNTFAFCKVLLSTIYQAVLALICVPLVPVLCGVTDSSLVHLAPGM
jgi:hypothetical protein